MSIALARSVPQVFLAATECRFPRTDHTDPPGCSTSTVRSSRVSRRNCSTVVAGTHGTPSWATISVGPKSSGSTSVSAVSAAWSRRTISWAVSSPVAVAVAVSTSCSRTSPTLVSRARTFPERKSARGTQAAVQPSSVCLTVSGSTNANASSSVSACVWSTPSSRATLVRSSP